MGKPGQFRTNMNRLGFTLVTYNCLAEIYATSEVYPYCPAWALPWNYRRRNILRELVAYHADIMCLQVGRRPRRHGLAATAPQLPAPWLLPRRLSSSAARDPPLPPSPGAQEVQADHYENFLEPELAKYNYAGLYKCKTREFMGQYGKMDGCAMFYRRDKFSILPGGAHDVEFNSIARMRHGNDKRLLNRLLRDNVAQIVAFEVNMANPNPNPNPKP